MQTTSETDSGNTERDRIDRGWPAGLRPPTEPGWAVDGPGIPVAQPHGDRQKAPGDEVSRHERTGALRLNRSSRQNESGRITEVNDKDYRGVVGTRDQALSASVELLGTQGMRALTHGRVDTAAGLPKGSTSNHFRTRAHLLHAVVDYLVAAEQEIFAAAGHPQNLDDLVASLSAFIRKATGPQRILTAARLAFFVEAFHDAQVRAVLAEGRSHIESWAARVLEALGSPQPFSVARRVLAHVEGTILHQLTFGTDTPPEDMEASLLSCLT